MAKKEITKEEKVLEPYMRIINGKKHIVFASSLEEAEQKFKLLIK